VQINTKKHEQITVIVTGHSICQVNMNPGFTVNLNPASLIKYVPNFTHSDNLSSCR